MLIRITRKGRRNRMTCIRPDGSPESSDLGPNLPHHDLAHFVVESRLRLKQGFFGNIAAGYTFAQLNEKETIRSLDAEAGVAEVVARALESVSTGACKPEQFEELVNTELTQWSLPTIAITARELAAMTADFEELLQRLAGLSDGESLQLDFALAG